MELTIEIAAFLLSSSGRELLAEAETLRAARTETLTALTRLRRDAAPARAAAAWELVDLRRRGMAKFGSHASQMYYTREALEQASSARAAAYHAAHFVAAGVRAVADLGGGIGGDSLAAASAGLDVTLWERDSVRAAFARENARCWDLQSRISVVEADVTVTPLGIGAAWFDPARRSENKRVYDPDEYSPPLSFLARLMEQGIVDIGVKLSPAIPHRVADEFGLELEFISDGGECKEALLWGGSLKTGNALSAIKLTDDGAIRLAGTPDSEADLIESAPETQLGVLYEPDPAVIRAHLVGTLAARLSADVLHPQIAYLIADDYYATPWASAYRIVERFPYSKRRLQDGLRSHKVGRLVIKKRGFPREPEEVRRELKLSGPNEMTLVLTRSARGHQALLCRPIEAEGVVPVTQGHAS